MTDLLLPRANINMEVSQGATFLRTFRWGSGDPVTFTEDLTTYTGRLQCREHVEDTTLIFDLSSTDGEILFPGDLGGLGYYQIYIPKELTATICPLHERMNAYYDLMLYDATGAARLQQYGFLYLIPSVTRI